MNLKIVLMSLFLTICAGEEIKGMSDREKEIVNYMTKWPARSKSQRSIDSKRAYLLSITQWNELGSKPFVTVMNKHVRDFRRVLAFQQFMEDKVPRNPVAINKDAGSYWVKYFSNADFSYVMSEHICMPDRIIIEEFNTRIILVLDKHEVEPEILLGEVGEV